MNRFARFLWTAMLLAMSAQLVGCGNGFGTSSSATPASAVSPTAQSASPVADPKKFWSDLDRAGPGTK
jgi:hypothetical protein